MPQPQRQQVQLENSPRWLQSRRPQLQELVLQGVWISSQTVVHGFWPLTLGPQPQAPPPHEHEAQFPGQLAGQVPPLAAQPQAG
ncbi:MAG TPA: hypothetical protein PK170_05935, partial [Anaerolineae bacterium]|nr:hypothetical protein [Anaerolineae bacterium]